MTAVQAPGDATRSTMRCFVGLWPDDDARERLDACARELLRQFPQARRVSRANFHLTLAFIGPLEARLAARVAARLQSLPAEAIAWQLDSLGHFEGARVAWAGGPPIAQLQTLSDAVRSLLDEAGVTFDRRPFVPHVTLLRHLPRRATELGRRLDPPIPWTVRQPVLLQSADGRYAEVLAGA